MTVAQLAEKLNGSSESISFSKEYVETLKNDRLVIVFPISDDQIYFIGAIQNCRSCYYTKDFYFTKQGIFKEEEDDKFFQKYRIEFANFFNKLTIDWNEFDWREITADFPHTAFSIFEEGSQTELYGFGIVFSINDLK